MHLAGMILPIFAIIVTGWLAGASGYMPRTLAAALMRFAYYVAMPALVFVTIAKEPLHSLLEWRFLAAFGGGSMLCFAAMMSGARIAWPARMNLSTSAMLAAAVAMTNTGFVALPILKTLYGQPGVLAAAVATVFVGAIMFPMLVVLLELGRRDSSHTLRAAPLIRQIATNPVILATLVGLLWSIIGVRLPAPVDAFLTILGEALTPCALFAIGLDLTIGELRERLGCYACLTALKLAVVPLVVYALCLATGLGHTATVAAVVCAAVPTAKSAYVLAVEYDIEKHVVGAVISMTTLFSIVTLLAWIAVL
ncbi:MULTISPECIES: AEC family transporter [unclassified Caballeronia]|uniref:AEC family transporter n=1 Tax=unclassified Caballeronia TaxID=2646786 RepID=UPI0028612AA0|nr:MULTISPECIES: AEC family transporter [unclassified Caballeronia]MDR5822782.1 AEC family transporter [Caballeronia sp. LZ043]MDR5880835.1 AEC family transporter [Caballeronia sp. LZ032]